jgi:uncharacterized phage-associated protein
MAKAFDVARYLLALGLAEEEPEVFTHLRLQKLLYYCQGWSLALRDKAIFKERIEAWAHGPVVANLYSVFADCKNDPIVAENYLNDEGRSGANLTEEERELVEAVWDAYKVHSAIQLRNMTHAESPWLDARKGHKAGERCNEEISRAAMKSFFTTELKKTKSK